MNYSGCCFPPLISLQSSMSKQLQNEFISAVSLSNSQQAHAEWKQPGGAFQDGVKIWLFFCKLLQKSPNQTTTHAVNAFTLAGIVHVTQSQQLTKPLCWFALSSWPFSLTDSIQPVALRVTRPFIALVKSFCFICILRQK